MKSPRPIAIVLSVFLLGWLVIHLVRAKEPAHQGRTLTEWLQTGEQGEWLGPSSPHYYPLMRVAVVPVETIGTNGIPTLLRLIQTRDSKLKRCLLAWQSRHLWMKLRLLPNWEKQNMGILGLMILGTNGVSAVPTLVQVIHERDGDGAFGAAYVLFCILECLYRGGGDGRDFSLSILQKLLYDSDREIQLSAANCLKVWFPEEADKAGVYKRFPQLQASSPNHVQTNAHAVMINVPPPPGR